MINETVDFSTWTREEILAEANRQRELAAAEFAHAEALASWGRARVVVPVNFGKAPGTPEGAGPT